MLHDIYHGIKFDSICHNSRNIINFKRYPFKYEVGFWKPDSSGVGRDGKNNDILVLITKPEIINNGYICDYYEAYSSILFQNYTISPSTISPIYHCNVLPVSFPILGFYAKIPAFSANFNNPIVLLLCG